MAGLPKAQYGSAIQRLLETMEGAATAGDMEPRDTAINNVLRSMTPDMPMSEIRQPTPEVPTGPPTAEELRVAEEPATVNPNLLRQGEVTRGQERYWDKVAVDLQDQLGLKPELGGMVEPHKVVPGLGLRFNIGRSENIEDMREKFIRKYPDGALIKMTDKEGTEHVLFRENEKQPWGVVGGAEAANILAKVATPQVGASIAAGIATGGASLPVQVGAQVLAGVAGKIADIRIERMQGHQQNVPIGESVRDVATEGAVAGTGPFLGPVAKAAKGLVDKARNVNIGSLFPGNFKFGERYLEAATEEGLPGPMIGYSSKNPLVQRTMRSVAGQSEVVGERKAARLTALEQRLEEKAQSSGGFQEMTGVELEAYTKIKKKEAEDALKTLTGQKEVLEGVDANAVDKVVKEKIDAWKGGEKERIRRKVEGNLSGVSKLEFDSTNLKDTAQRMEIFSRTDEGDLMKTGGPTGALNALSVKAQNLADTIGPQMALKDTKSALQQLGSLRQEAFELMQNSTGEQRELAERLHGAIRDMMMNPKGSRSVLANNRIRKGMAEWDDYEDTLRIYNRDLGDTDAVSDRIFRPEKFDLIKRLRDNAPEQFEVARIGFMNKLNNNPDQIINTLDSYKKANRESTLRLFMSEDDENAYRSFAKAIKRLDEGRANLASKADTTGVENAQSFIFGAGQFDAETMLTRPTVRGRELSEFVESSGGKDSARANDLRAGIYRYILDESMTKTEESGGRWALDPGKIKAFGEKLQREKKSLDGLMRPEDWRSLDNLSTYATMLTSMREGGELMAGQQASTLAQVGHAITNPDHYLFTAMSVLQQRRLAEIMSRPLSSDMMLQAVQSGGTKEGVRKFDAAIAVAAKGIAEDRTQERLEKPEDMSASVRAAYDTRKERMKKTGQTQPVQ